MVRKIAIAVALLGVMAGCVGEGAPGVETDAEVPTRVSTDTPQPTEPFLDKDAFSSPEPAIQPTSTPNNLTPGQPPLSTKCSGPVRISFSPNKPRTQANSEWLNQPIAQPEVPIFPKNIDQLAELATWGYGRIDDLLFVSDDQIMVVQTPIALYAYLSGSLKEVWRVESPESISTLSVSSSGDLLAFGTNEGKLHVVDASNGIVMRTWQAHEGAISTISISFDGNFLASGGEDKSIRVWPLEDDQDAFEITCIEEVKDLFYTKQDEKLAIWVWNPEVPDTYIFLEMDTLSYAESRMSAEYTGDIDSKHDIYADGFGFWRISTQERISRFEFDEIDFTDYGPFDTDISFDGSLVIMDIVGPGVGLWRVSDGKLLNTFETNKEEESYYPGKVNAPLVRSGPGPSAIRDVAISRDNRFLYARNGYGVHFLWDIESGELVREFSGVGEITDFSPDNQMLVSLSVDSLDIYNVTTGDRIAEIQEEWQYTNLFFSPGGKRLANGSRLWVVDSGELQYAGYGESILGFSSNGLQFYTISPQWWVRQRSVVNLEMRRQTSLEIPLIEDEWWASSIDYQWYEMGGWKLSSDKKLINGSAYELPVLSWNVDDGSFEFATVPNPDSITAYSPNGDYFVNYGSVSGLSVYDARSDEYTLLYNIPFERDIADDVSVSPDGNLLAVTAGQSVYVFDIETGDQIIVIDVPYDADYFTIRSAIITPDSQLLLVTVYDNVFLFDLEKGELVRRFEGHFGTIYSAAFSPDGKLLAMAAYDGTVRLWGIPND
ncbi:MAG: hypothetical protein OEV06_10750 [Anaerolineae bacterium]|nr:hypothetical protein [Anaerolineae bacterium]